MFKQPLAHRLRKAIGNDSANTKPSGTQKHVSPSILGGLRTPFASLFSSFRKSKRQQNPKPQHKPQEYSPRYDHFAAGAHMSSKVEEMAKTKACDSSLPSEPTKKCFETNQTEKLDDSSCTWNEQLENELLRVLGNLDDQLAQEQSQDVVNRRTPTHYGSRASEIDHHSTATRHSFHGGVQRNERSMFLSDGTRTLRAKDERQTFFRPRVFYDTYMKRHYTEDLTYGDGYNRRSPALKRGHSTCSLGHSSEGSLQLSSGQQSSGFAHKDFMTRDTVSRSCSLSCLARGQSLTSVDQLSKGSLQHPLGNNRGFTQKSYHHQTKRIPLSSIAWNTPQTSEHPLYGNRLLRTQSLMEFGPAFEDTAPCIPQENAGYDFYRSKIDYRRPVPNPSHSIFAGNTDSLYFDKRDNYLLHQMERNNWKPRYRYPSFHSRMNLSCKSFPSGRIEEQLFRPDNAQYYSDEVFLASESSHEGFPTNVGDWQNPCAKNPGLRLRQWESDAQIHVGNMDHPEGVTGNLFSKHADGIQRCPTYGLSVPKRQTQFAVQRQNLFTQNAQSPSQTLVKHFQPNKNFKTHTLEGVRSPGQSGKVNSGHTQEETLRRVSGQMDTNSPAESQISPPTHCSVGVPPLPLRSPAKLTSLRNRENIYLSNIHSKKEQRNQDSCTVNCDLAQMPPSQLTANGTRSLIQSLQRVGHRSETPKDIIHSKTSKNICSSVSRKGSEILVYNELPSTTKNWPKQNRFVKHATSNSITGSPSNSPPRSPVTYYTLPRKSASIDGSVVSDKLVSHPFRQVPNRNKITMKDNLEMLESNGTENIYSNKRENITLLSPVDSSLSPSSKEVICKEIPQTQGYHLQLTQDPKHPLGDPSAIPSKSEKEDLVCCTDKTETSVFSECEGKDAGNPLKQYKTTSTLTVRIEEDNVKYHELISVYYTLPRKRSRMLCNLFLDDTKNTDSSSPTGKSHPTEKKYEVRINLATLAFPSSLQKEEKTNLPTKMNSSPSMQQNSNTSCDATKESTHTLNPVGEKAGGSQSMAHDKEKTVRSPTEAPKPLLSNRLGSDGPLDKLKHCESEDDSLHAVTNTLHNLRIDSGLSQQTEGSEAHTLLNLHSSKPTEGKISLDNHPTASSAVYVQKDKHMRYLISTEPPANTNPHIPPSHLSSNDQEGKCTTHQDFTTTVNSTEDKITQDIEVKERPHSYVCRKSSKKGNELQIRNENVRNSTHNALTSEIKIHSNFENRTLQMDAISSENSVQKPNSSLDYSNIEEEPISQNSVLHKVCTNSQRPVRNSSDKQNLNSKDQLTNTTKNLPDDSAGKNKLNSDCTKDKASDIEKRKNRSSIKNKLAAMYKTSRKFSSKKTMSPKPHISNIFSQNDVSLLEINNPSSMLISSSIPQLPLQTGNENQNQIPLPDESEDTMHDKSENKKLQTNEGLPSLSSETRRPFTNLCNQKWESPSSKQSGKKIGITQNSTALFSKEIISKVHNNPQVCDGGFKHNSQPTFSRVTVTVPDQKKKDSNVAEPSAFPLSSNKKSNILITNYSKANICPPQEVISPTESSHHQNIKQTSRFRKLNQSSVETVLNPSKVQRERHFSESSYVRESHDHLVSGSNVMRPGSRYSRKFKSYSELLSCDENENWDAYDGSSRAFGSRRVMYPSIEFGIFGKEQQQAFLDNIKRSLTEGRLWRPCLLNNPRSLNKEDGFPLNSPEQLHAGFAKTNVSAEGASRPFEIHKDPADYSESDSDTTTDDEYYLDENDKESEL
ncbi:exophilin-5 isoform X2 [Sceloporus undulatus]|nr:exophilin-5 isoform X2 [Sceloporus undulatus]XP_042315024.1 exophilin-5 isoform X2 [Sceloporus undulatus]